MWPGLSVKDIDEINKLMQVSSKTPMSNAIFHNLESGSNELQSGFSENQLKLIEKGDTQRYLAKCRIAVITVISGLTCKRGERVNFALCWPVRLVCMPFETKEYLTAGATVITAIQNLVVYNTFPESFDPQRTFGNPLRAVFSKIEIFSGTAKFSSLYAGGPRMPPLQGQ